MTPLYALFTPSPQDIIILLILGVLLFGRKLPEVGKYLGKGIVEFKKGLRGIEDEVDTTAQARHEPAAVEPPRPPQRVGPAAPKFEDPTATPPSNAVTTPSNQVTTPPQA
jgi:sec-independent protein translocase protein TatA